MTARGFARFGSRQRCQLAASVAALVLILTACGTQLPKSKIIAAANGSSTGGGQLSDSQASGAGGTGSDVSGGVAGGSTSAGGSATGGGGGGQAGAGGTGAQTGGAGGATATGGGASGSSGGTHGGVSGGAGVRLANLSPVVIGNVGEYSGVVGSIFPGGPAAMQAWAQAANTRGGLNGHPVKVVAADDGSDPARGLSLVKQMVEGQGAIALAGSMIPLSFPGIRPYLDQKGIPLVGGDVTLAEWIQDPLIFPMGTDVTSISVGAVNLITAGGLNKLAIVYCGESPSCKALADAAGSKPPPGVQTVYTAQISIAQTDFTTECLTAKSKGAQAIFVAADANSVIRVGRSCAQQQYKPRYGTASIAVGPQLAADPNMNGLIAPVNNAPWFLSNTPGTREFATAMRTYAPGAPLSAPAASMYASGLLLEASASRLGPTARSADLIAGLSSQHNQTLNGLAPSLSFSPGQPSGPIKCYFVVAVQNGQWVAPNGATPQCV
jgi:branched-chain amino acid transport system substrate-binding protein